MQDSSSQHQRLRGDCQGSHPGHEWPGTQSRFTATKIWRGEFTIWMGVWDCSSQWSYWMSLEVSPHAEQAERPSPADGLQGPHSLGGS